MSNATFHKALRNAMRKQVSAANHLGVQWRKATTWQHRPTAAVAAQQDSAQVAGKDGAK